MPNTVVSFIRSFYRLVLKHYGIDGNQGAREPIQSHNMRLENSSAFKPFNTPEGRHFAAVVQEQLAEVQPAISLHRVQRLSHVPL